jgi:NAD(P)-dependent dehydrogenase (short-subunit alcohol dehydrogenase family)
MQLDISDQVALVTGSAHRVGKAIAIELAKAGVNILVHYHSSENDTVRETVQEIKSHGVDAFPVQANIALPDGVETVFAALRERYGRLNILVNSASVFHKNTFLEVTPEDWQRSLAVNLTAPLLCSQAAVPLMRSNDPSGGVIINICDYGSVRPWIDRVDHGVSKAGLLMLTKVAAVSLGPEHVRVNGIVPGPVLQSAGLSDDMWARIGDRLPLGHTGEPGDVARAVVYLASENFLTGTILEVSGGEHLL